MDSLSDPKGDRIVKNVKAPPHRPLSTNLMFPDKLKGIFYKKRQAGLEIIERSLAKRR